MGEFLTRRVVLTGLAAPLILPAEAQRRANKPPADEGFSAGELVQNGHKFFGKMARGLAEAIESVTSKNGKPNGYILGQEGSGALVFGLRYGEGQLFRKRGGESKVFWQGPSFGLDAGGDGDRTMMLIYKLGDLNDFYERFGGMDGSAYIIGGFGITALKRDDTLIIPIRSGLGMRLGVNVGYLKFAASPTWNPF
jgi:hypothetical protein